MRRSRTWFLGLILLAAWAWPSLASTPPPVPLAKEDIAFLLNRPQLSLERLDRVQVAAGPGRHFLIQTTLDLELQDFLIALLERSRVPYAALVALDPRTGQVKALVSHSAENSSVNYALAPAFPAASVFKMVTAAAALEAAGLTPKSQISYRGRAHTLYKGQISDKKSKGAHKPSLTESFAKSVNPVFGKLAVGTVGPEVLEEFAFRFGFNQAIRFELPLKPSHVDVPRDDRFELAAVGSGYNRETTISPLHGALMAASVINQGVMMEPTVVARVEVVQTGRPAQEVYVSRPQVQQKVFSLETAERMRRLMAATVTSGTGRGVFRQAGYDRVLRHLEIGGKTGTINDPTQTYRVDWFVGYAAPKDGAPALAVGVLAAHDLDRRAGMRSLMLAKETFKAYYKSRFPHEPPAKAKTAPPKKKTYKNKKKHQPSAAQTKARAKEANS